jgi:hypothetical protein
MYVSDSHCCAAKNININAVSAGPKSRTRNPGPGNFAESSKLLFSKARRYILAPIDMGGQRDRIDSHGDKALEENSIVLALAAITTFVTIPAARAQESIVDPDAVQILKRMTDAVSGLKYFSVHTENTLLAVRLEIEFTPDGYRQEFHGAAGYAVGRVIELRANCV